MALQLLKQHLRFDKDVKVHVFETVIRVLGGLLSAHMLLTAQHGSSGCSSAQAAGGGLDGLPQPPPGLRGYNSSQIPAYDGLLLDLAVNLADRLLPAFDTPSGLPSLFVNLATVCMTQQPTQPTTQPIGPHAHD